VDGWTDGLEGANIRFSQFYKSP